MAVQQPLRIAPIALGPLVEGVVVARSPAPDPAPSPVWLGVKARLTPLEPVQARRIGQSAGLAIERVSRRSPAARSGVRPADLLLSVDGFVTDFNNSLRQALTGRRSGDKVRLRLIRDGRDIQIVAEVGAVT